MTGLFSWDLTLIHTRSGNADFFVDKGVLCGIWRERGCFGDMALINACALDTNV